MVGGRTGINSGKLANYVLMQHNRGVMHPVREFCAGLIGFCQRPLSGIDDHRSR